MSAIDPVDWRTIDGGTFNSVVESLLIAEYTTSSTRARAIDGRGGDGGIDVGVWDLQNRLLQVFQLKHYRDGWSSAHASRRRQIRESFERAWDGHHPPAWSLVTASNPTMSELQLVMDLGAGKDVDVDVLGRAELDVLLGKHPNVHERFFTDRALKLLSAVHRPEEALVHLDDTSAVLKRIYSRIQMRSQFWGSKLEIDVDGSTTETLVPLRPDASSREPLQAIVSTNFGPDDESLRIQFERSLDYGFAQPMVLPSGVVASIERIGPEWWAGTWAGGSIEIHPPEVDNVMVARALSFREGNRLGSVDGITKRVVTGKRGGSILLAFEGGLEMRLQLSTDKTDGGGVQLSLDNSDRNARSKRRVVRFLRSLESADELQLEVGALETLALGAIGGIAFDIDVGFEQFLDDIIFIEDALDISLPLPVDPLSLDDRIWLRVARRVLEGVAVPFPGIDGFNFTLNGKKGIAPRLEERVAAVLIQQNDFVVTLLGKEVRLGHVFIAQSFGTFEHGEEHAKALREGRGADRVVHVRAVDDLPFLIYLPERVPPKRKEVKVATWAIPGIPEHPRLSAYRKRRLGLKELPNADRIHDE